MRRDIFLSTSALLAANIITIIFAIKSGWSLNTLMLIYWFQSITIGYFQYRKIKDLKRFSTKNLKINNRPVKPDQKTKDMVLRFFPLHYGIFHIAYLAFIGIMPLFENLLLIIASAVTFFINHAVSYKKHRKQESEKVKNIGTMMFFPYLRILPMHITLIIGTNFEASGSTLLFFMVIKSAVDVIMHLIEHKSPKEIDMGKIYIDA